jgi:four helix bundle protein
LEKPRKKVCDMIQSYKDLEVYKTSYELSLKIYQFLEFILVKETRTIIDQAKRASLSIPLNIAEGFGKKESVNEFKRYLRISLGSCNEMMVLLDFIKDLGYMNTTEYDLFYGTYDLLARQIATLINKWK